MSKKLLIRSAVVLVVIVAGVILIKALFFNYTNVPTIQVQRGNFVIKLTESGKIEAKKSQKVVAPRASRRLLITWMADEGSMVNQGDPLIIFDQTEQKDWLSKAELSLEEANANYLKAEGNYDLDVKDLELQLEKAERNAKEKQYESEAVRKEAVRELELVKMKLAVKKKDVEADLRTLKLKLESVRRDKESAEKELASTIVRAENPGLLVYLDIWKGGGTMGKPQVGDTPWPGQDLMELPDLSTMLLKTQVSEVDGDKVRNDQVTYVTLDAFPDTVFRGKVTRVGTIAKKKDYQSDINVFEVEVTLDAADPRLKPGMSAKGEIIVEEIPNSVWLPIESVFEKDGKTVAYVMGGGRPQKKEVRVGKRNDTSIIIKEGLKGDELVCLQDPTQKTEGEKVKIKEIKVEKGIPDTPEGSQELKEVKTQEGTKGEMVPEKGKRIRVQRPRKEGTKSSSSDSTKVELKTEGK
ncbi:MAG: HlyD family efflux transporter periplasmic adaptor subunit [candidate division Zixibacteria bacterium]|nr:HlyD family efflux transporter periplasmic adaptor subunit [candidate division Zixibacteria bacterium]